MNYSTFSPTQIATAAERIEKVFDPSSIREIARKTGFVRRWTGRLDGSELFRVMVEKALNPTSASLNIICDALAELNPKAEMTVQALQQRISSPECAHFFESVLFDRVVSTTRDAWKALLATSTPRGRGPLVRFNKVWLADSTEFPLQKALSKHFKGSGGAKNAESLLKILAIYEVTSGMLGKFVICDRTSPDQKLADHILQQTEKDQLVLMDRGFFSVGLLDQLDEKGAFFITRLHGSVNVYKFQTDEEPLSIGRYAAEKIAKNGFCDEVLYLGKKKKKFAL